MTSLAGGPARGAVVAGFDGSGGASSAVHWAADEAVRRERTLLIVQALEWAPPIMQGWTSVGISGSARIRQHANHQLDQIAEKCRDLVPGLAVRTALLEGRPAEKIAGVADQEHAELIVVGSSGMSALPRALLGSTAVELVRAAHEPVIVVRGEHRTTRHAAPVIVGVDGSPVSDEAVGFAFDFAARHNAPLRVVHALEDLPMDLASTQGDADSRDEAAAELIRRHVEHRRRAFPQVRVETEVVDSRPAHALMTLAEHAKLLIVGSRGRGPLRRMFFGSVSHAVLYNAPCPVAVVSGTGEKNKRTA